MNRLVVLVLAGCASGGTAAVTDGPSSGPDAKVYLDGQIEPSIDAAIDARAIDAAVDARPAIDATLTGPDACAPHTTQLLLNPVFDLAPIGADWHQTPIEAASPPITGDGPYAAQTPPYKVWLGGFTGADEGAASATDVVYQDVAVPASTTELVLTGYYTAGTTESPNNAVYDTANVDLLQTDGTPIEPVLALSNLTNTGPTWVQFSHTFTANVSGTTVRLRLTSTNDITNVSNFFFDTFALSARHCP
jgi:hypothetical protein